MSCRLRACCNRNKHWYKVCHKMKRSNHSEVWKHFAQNDDQATCHHCSKKISCKDGSTSGLSRHLKSQHSSLSRGSEEQSCFKKAKVQQKSMMSFVTMKKDSLQSIVSELAAVEDFLSMLYARVSSSVSRLVPKLFDFLLQNEVLWN